MRQKCSPFVVVRVIQTDTVPACTTSSSSWLRWLIVACGVLILCSCKAVGIRATPPDRAASVPGTSPPAVVRSAPTEQDAAPSALESGGPNAAAAAESNSEVTQVSYDCPTGGYVSLPPEAYGGCQDCLAGWSPPGLRGPWPSDEYICDGGDRAAPVGVARNWNVGGLDREDTIVHYDTLSGDTKVEASNRVCIYAPRFAAVRKVYGLSLHQQNQRSAGVDLPTRVSRSDELQIASTAMQPVEPGRYLGLRTANNLLENEFGRTVDNTQVSVTSRAPLLAYENFKIIQQGVYENSEKLRLNEWIQAARTWTANQGVQIIIDNMTASQIVGDSRLQSVYTYVVSGKPRLRVIKVASKQNALPGEEVDFTLRFDNIGDETIGNVTVIDNLTNRLEYVEDSQSSSLEAEFFAVQNEGESLILRWEIADPMKVGQGGIIRFKCKVR